jgi:hypothetical protein
VYPRLLGTVAGELETKALKLMYNHGLEQRTVACLAKDE